MPRQSVYVEGFSHSTPIPAACKIGNILVSGLVTGIDLSTGHLASGFEAQCANVFSTMAKIVITAGGSVDDIIKLTVWLNDRSLRQLVNHEWLKMFPEPAMRPARATINRELGDGKLVECEFMAILPSPAVNTVG